MIVLTKGERDVPTLETISKGKKKGEVRGHAREHAEGPEDVAQLTARGVDASFLESLHSPGVDIGAITPEEVVVSIMADVMATKRGKHLPHAVFLSKVLGEKQARSSQRSG